MDLESRRTDASVYKLHDTILFDVDDKFVMQVAKRRPEPKFAPTAPVGLHQIKTTPAGEDRHDVTRGTFVASGG